MKFAIAIIVVFVAAAGLAILLAQRGTRTAELTAGESKIRDLVREVYAGNIVSERVERDGRDAILFAELRNEKLKRLQVNLTSLARKHEQEGVSLAVLKRSLRFD